jgi:hypothetical protein
MTEQALFQSGTMAMPSEAVLAILRHLCLGTCKTFGSVLEWCESRGDCAQAVVCPSCGARFLVENEDLEELARWTAESGEVLTCGVRWE